MINFISVENSFCNIILTSPLHSLLTWQKNEVGDPMRSVAESLVETFYLTHHIYNKTNEKNHNGYPIMAIADSFWCQFFNQ